jgi:integrase
VVTEGRPVSSRAVPASAVRLSRPASPALTERQAVKAAGLEHRTPYSLRHTAASFAIAAGIPTFEIARMMGTSIQQIETTYGHLLPDALDRGRAALEAFDVRAASAEKGGIV